MLITWIIYFVIISIFYKWLISWGGAERIEGWLSFIVIGWFALDWKAEQIKFFTIIMWLFFTMIFLYGLFNPRFRYDYFIY